MSRFERHRRGMTLIEVLVALAVVAITLTAGLKAAGGLTVNAQRLTDLTIAQWCVENELTVLRVTHALPGPGDSDFSCAQLGHEWQGVLHVKTVPGNADYRQIEAQVMDEKQQTILRLSTVMSRF